LIKSHAFTNSKGLIYASRVDELAHRVILQNIFMCLFLFQKAQELTNPYKRQNQAAPHKQIVSSTVL